MLFLIPYLESSGFSGCHIVGGDLDVGSASTCLIYLAQVHIVPVFELVTASCRPCRYIADKSFYLYKVGTVHIDAALHVELVGINLFYRTEVLKGLSVVFLVHLGQKSGKACIVVTCYFVFIVIGYHIRIAVIYIGTAYHCSVEGMSGGIGLIHIVAI